MGEAQTQDNYPSREFCKKHCEAIKEIENSELIIKMRNDSDTAHHQEKIRAIRMTSCDRCLATLYYREYSH
jgi:hypothetical protein